LHTLLDYAVRLISERFRFYHAGIFLIDQPGEYAVLASASSEGGQRMLSRGHKLKIGEVGIVGFVAGSGQPRIALDVGKDAIYFNNPDLPETRSEMALSMKAHGKITGVLDVQSTEPAAFTKEDISTLQILADQIALAIENARLLEASQKALDELEAQYRRQIGANWHQYLSQKEIGFVYDRMGIEAISPEDLKKHPQKLQQATQPQKSDLGQGGALGEHKLLLPIELKGVLIGQIQLDREEGKPGWTAADLEMVKNTLSQISLALENARLQEAVRRKAEKELLANKIAARVQSSLEIETVMKRTVQEIGQALKVARVQIQLVTDEPAKAASGNGKSEAPV
jgi:GAF domain-containing protein